MKPPEINIQAVFYAPITLNRKQYRLINMIFLKNHLILQYLYTSFLFL